MDERSLQPASPGSPVRDRSPQVEPGGNGRALDDPRALTILTTEHWSLLSARALVYNEAFARGGMFLTFLSATLVALGLVATATGFNRDFLVIAAVTFGADLFIGLATMGRIAAATREDVRCLQGMNRLRHAYHETVPGLERYFISGKYDDAPGVFAVYGVAQMRHSRPNILHHFTTTVGMIGVICAVVAGVLAGVLLLLLTDSTAAAAAGALGVLALGVIASMAVAISRIAQFAASMEPIFPSPPPGATRES